MAESENLKAKPISENYSDFNCDAFINAKSTHLNKWITAEEAAKGHKLWLQERSGQNMDADDRAIGSVVSAGHFQKEMVQLMLDNADCFGIRVYYCKSIGDVSNVKDTIYRDVFLMPTDKDGMDMFPLRKMVNDSSVLGTPIEHKNVQQQQQQQNINFGILNASMPCPDHCSSQFMKYE